MIFSNEYVHSVHAMCLAQNSAFFVRGFNTIRVSRFLHFKVRYWVRSIYCWNTPASVTGKETGRFPNRLRLDRELFRVIVILLTMAEIAATAPLLIESG